MSIFESFRAARWIRTINLVLQALLFTTLFAGLNHLAVQYAWRFELAPHRRHALSPETLSYLKQLPSPVRVIVTVSEDTVEPQLIDDVRSILREFAYATEANSGGRRITVEYLDVFQRPRDAKQLGVDQSNAIFFLCGEKKHAVAAGELYRFEQGAKKDLIAEQAFTSALLDVCSNERKKIYFLAGHGEWQPDDVHPLRGLSALRSDLIQRNFAVDTLDIGHTRKVPDDAALVVAVAPQRVEPFAQEQLRQYLSAKAGRLILLLATRVDHGLDDLLYEWGVMVDDDVIYDINPDSTTEEGDLRIGAYHPTHPIVSTLREGNRFLRLGETRSLRPDPGRTAAGGLTVTTLVATSKTAWGERAYRLPQLPQFDPGRDIKGLPQMDPAERLGVAVASERVQARSGLPFSVRGGRLVVIGAADLASNHRWIGSSGNQMLFLNAVNWTVDRDAQLTIPPRPVRKFQLSLSQQQLQNMRYALFFGVPSAMALLGLMVYWSRRR